MQAGAVTILGVAARALRYAATAASRWPSCSRISAEGEPGRGEIRRQLDRLQQEIGRAGEIAAQLQVAGEIVAAVGDQIAGGQEQGRRHRAGNCRGRARLSKRQSSRLERRSSPPMTAEISQRAPIYLRCARKTSCSPAPAGLCCQPRRFPHRPGAAGRARADHAWPFRPCPLRPWRGAGDARDARHHGGCATATDFAGTHAGGRLRRGRSGSAMSA